MKVLRSLSDLLGVRCAVLGFGVSNRPLVALLLEHGALVTVRDQKAMAELGEEADAFAARGVRFITGADYLENLYESVIFRSPGFRPDLPQISEAVARGAMLTSEMELFLELTPATVIGITGSDGKTTTTTLTGLMLESACARRGHGQVFVGGNIGEPLLPRLSQMTADDFCAVELSSFQLQTMRRSASRAAVTNLSENHLNWHHGMSEYVEAKTNIYRHMQNQRLVTNAECEMTLELAQRCEQPVTYFSSVRTSYTAFLPLLKARDRAVYCRDGVIILWDGEKEIPMLEAARIRLPGRHNLENYMTAIALTDGFATDEDILAVAKDFTGVKHRLELVRTLDGVEYYNSSIDSSPTRTAAALSAIQKKPIVICGGRNKGLDFVPLADALCARAKAVILTGEAAREIGEVLYPREEVRRGDLRVLEEPDFDRAVCLAHNVAVCGDAVLLSPACTSFDAFQNFEERGECFRRIVNEF